MVQGPIRNVTEFFASNGVKIAIPSYGNNDVATDIIIVVSSQTEGTLTFMAHNLKSIEINHEVWKMSFVGKTVFL